MAGAAAVSSRTVGSSLARSARSAHQPPDQLAGSAAAAVDQYSTQPDRAEPAQMLTLSLTGAPYPAVAAQVGQAAARSIAVTGHLPRVSDAVPVGSGRPDLRATPSRGCPLASGPCYQPQPGEQRLPGAPCAAVRPCRAAVELRRVRWPAAAAAHRPGPFISGPRAMPPPAACSVAPRRAGGLAPAATPGLRRLGQVVIGTDPHPDRTSSRRRVRSASAPGSGAGLDPPAPSARRPGSMPSAPPVRSTSPPGHRGRSVVPTSTL